MKTTVSPGTADVVHLVSNPEKEKQKGAAGQAADNAKQEAKGKIQEAKDQVHDSWQKITAPGKMHRLKQFLLAQSPYRRQYLEPGTRFVADLDAPLDFGEATRTGEQLAEYGKRSGAGQHAQSAPGGGSQFGDCFAGHGVAAILTEPLYSPIASTDSSGEQPLGRRSGAGQARAETASQWRIARDFRAHRNTGRVQQALLQTQKQAQAQAAAENAPMKPQAIPGDDRQPGRRRSGPQGQHEAWMKKAARAPRTARRGICRPGSPCCWRQPRRTPMPSMARWMRVAIRECALPRAAPAFVLPGRC